jgi:glycosyltransferase involved in cell wall biosynthesis
MRDCPLLVIARLFRRRTITHIHGGRFIGAGTPMPVWLRIALKVSVGAGPVVVLSHVEKTWFNAGVKEANVFVLPNCVAIDEAQAFERLWRAEGPVTVLYLGRISLHKGIDVIYQSIEILKERGANIRFVLAGTGPDEAVYVQKFRHLLGDRFSFKGVVGDSAKTRVMKECDVFLLPSMFEGLPMALLECMAFGLVPVTTRVGSIPSIVIDGSNGLLLRENTPAEVVWALDRLLADRQLLRALGSGARASILDGERPKAYLEQLNEIYEYDDRACVSLRQ